MIMAKSNKVKSIEDYLYKEIEKAKQEEEDNKNK